MGENCLAIFSETGPFAVLVPDGQGGWQVDFTGDQSAQQDQYGYLISWNYSLLYDGDRLAVVGRLPTPQQGNNYSLSVYDRDGLAYLGVYRSSLPGQVSPLYHDSPSHVLSWSETPS